MGFSPILCIGIVFIKYYFVFIPSCRRWNPRQSTNGRFPHRDIYRAVILYYIITRNIILYTPRPNNNKKKKTSINVACSRNFRVISITLYRLCPHGSRRLSARLRVPGPFLLQPTPNPTTRP